MNISNEQWYLGGDNVNGQGVLTAERQGAYVCLIPDSDTPDQAARMGLIAAAPELLEALQACRNTLKQTAKYSKPAYEALVLADAALAKARGEAS